MQPNNLQYVNPNFSGVSSDYATRNSGTIVGNTPAPQLPPVIDASTLGSTKTPQLPTLPSTAPTTDLSSILGAGIDTSAQQTSVTNSQNELLAQQKALTEKAAYQTQAETNAGLLEYKKQLSDVNAQINQLQKESAQAAQLQQGRTGPQFAIDAGKADIERVRTIKALGLSSIAQTLQGNVALAQDYADRAVKEKFAPIEAQIEYLKTALEINKDNLSTAEKKKAEQQKVLLDERTRLLEQQKEDAKTIIGFAAEAAKNGAPALVINRAQAAKTPTEALSILSGYFTDPTEKAQALANLEKTRAQTAEAYSNMNLKAAELKAKLAEKAVTTVIDPVTGKPTSELKLNARDSAKVLLEKFINGEGTSAVGSSRVFGLQYIPGRAPKDFTLQFDNLKSLLSLDNVKLLKGQGAVSDAERKLLSDASSNLNLSHSESEFKKNLTKISIALGNTEPVYLKDPKTGQKQQVTVDSSGLFRALADGLEVTY